MAKNLRNVMFVVLVLVGMSLLSQQASARDIWCDDILSIQGEGTCTDMENTILELSWPENTIITCEGYCTWLTESCGDHWGWYGTVPSGCHEHGTFCEEVDSEWYCDCLCAYRAGDQQPR